MNPRIACAVLIFFGLMPALSAADDAGMAKGCEAKRNAINQQLEQARETTNEYKQRGLEKALRQNQRHCTDASLKKEQADKVNKARKEVGQRKADLAAAVQKGDAEKVNKRKAKLADAEQELKTELDLL